MAIETTEFANVSISVSPTGVGSGNFGILGFLTNETGVIGVAERYRAYTSLASVAGDWGTSTEVYKAATAFYSQTPAPTDFVVHMCFETAQKASLIGGGHATLEKLKLVAGTSSFNITIDGTPSVLSTLNFSAATNLAGVATILDAALPAGNTVIYNGYGFEITGVTTGPSGSITFGTGSTSDLLGLSQHQGKISAGIAAETPVAALAAALAMGMDTTALVTHKKYRDITGQAVGNNTEDIADWAEAAKRIFCNTSNNLSVLSSVITTDIMSVLKAKTLRYTLSTFSKSVAQYPSASVFGRAASVNFSNIGSTITLNLKQMPTITAEDLTPSEFQVLRSKNGSAVVRIGKSVNAYTDSRMASGSWLDTTHGLMWLENRIEVDMFNFLYQSNTKVPYTQTGINQTIQVLDKSLQGAVRNGLAGPGYLPDGTFLPKGYIINFVPLADTPSSDKSNRLYAGLSFKMVGAGALHEVVVNGEFTE